MEEELVSVIIPTHNVSDFILQTVNSVLDQTYKNLEVIVVDDASSDDTVALLRSIDDPRLKIIQNAENKGAGFTRSRGLEAAQGRYVAFLDSDDFWYPSKLEHQIRFMNSVGAAICYTHYNLVDETGRFFAKSEDMPATTSKAKLLRHCFIRTSSLVYDAKVIGSDMRFSSIRKRQDFVFFIALLERADKAYLLDEVTCAYRIRPGSVSGNKLANIRYQWMAYVNEIGVGRVRAVFLMLQWAFLAGKRVLARRAKSRWRG